MAYFLRLAPEAPERAEGLPIKRTMRGALPPSMRPVIMKRSTEGAFQIALVASAAGSRLAYLTMVFTLALAAEKQRRTWNGAQLIAAVIKGVPFVDGIRNEAA